ncbi:MAG: 3D domain-containing protein [Candidatus Pacebacteria bacterium]|nr:3D domain-containing protein [Candidatus Paceibacterota bacterium]
MSKRFLSNVRSRKHSLLITVIAITSITVGILSSQHLTGAVVEQKTNKNQNNSCDIKAVKGFSMPELSFQKGNLLNEMIVSEEKKEEKVLATIIKTTGSVKGAEIAVNEESTESSTKQRKLVLVTAYSSTVDQTDSTPFITANGTHVYDGTIAANFLKFGTKVKFPSLYGDKIFTVEDRMKSDYKVDIWFPTRQEALNFGAKRVEIEIQ